VPLAGLSGRSLQHLAQGFPQLSEWEPGGLRAGADEIGAGWERSGRGDRGTKTPPQPIAGDRRPDSPSDRVRESRRRPGISVEKGYRDRPPAYAPATIAQGPERPAVPDPPYPCRRCRARGPARLGWGAGPPGRGATAQPARRCRPLRLRAWRMARPARVAIRWRNPWFLARLRVFGWKVRFTHRLPGPSKGAGSTTRAQARPVVPG